jgi:hypothetical protein
MEGSKKWSLSKEELKKKGKQLFRGAMYSILIGAVAMLGDVDVKPEYAFLLPFVVQGLTTLSHTVKLFCTDTK